jgi:hypothetical protein
VKPGDVLLLTTDGFEEANLSGFINDGFEGAQHHRLQGPS